MTKRAPVHGDNTSLGFRYRDAFKLLTVLNGKTPKGEADGFFSAILYLMPHTSGGGATLCPYSTTECQAMCLAGAGLSGLPRQIGAKMRRTQMFNHDRERFLDLLLADIDKLKRVALQEGFEPALRLNGSSDVMWERVIPGWADLGLQRYDYSKIPLEHRTVDPGYNLTFSIEGPRDMERAIGYLRGDQNVAVVVPDSVKHMLVGCEFDIGDRVATFIDGDQTDLRFLDEPGSVVLLKPKGYVRTDLMRPQILSELRQAAKPPSRQAAKAMA